MQEGGSLDPYSARLLPTIGIIEAVRRADEYIREQKIDIKGCYLNRVQFLEKGKRSFSKDGEDLEGLCWVVEYIPASRITAGGQVLIYVYGDGKIGHEMGI